MKLMNFDRLIFCALLLHDVWTCDLTEIFQKKKNLVAERGKTRGCVLPRAVSAVLLWVKHMKGKRCEAGRALQAARTRPACTPLIPQARGATPVSLHLIKWEPRSPAKRTSQPVCVNL